VYKLITLITLITFISFAFTAFAGGEEIISCTCKLEVGMIGIPESEEVVSVTVEFANEGFFEATGYEADIFVASECIKKFKIKDTRKVFGAKSIDCK